MLIGDSGLLFWATLYINNNETNNVMPVADPYFLKMGGGRQCIITVVILSQMNRMNFKRFISEKRLTKIMRHKGALNPPLRNATCNAIRLSLTTATILTTAGSQSRQYLQLYNS